MRIVLALACMALTTTLPGIATAAEEVIPPGSACSADDAHPRTAGDWVYYLNMPNGDEINPSTWNMHDIHWNAYGVFYGGWGVPIGGTNYYEFQILSGYAGDADFCNSDGSRAA